MSRDPLEELFGISDEGDRQQPATEQMAPVQPAPVPARNRLVQEQAERVRTSQLPAGKSGPATRATSVDPSRAAQAKPWIVVGVIAVLAIVASIVVLNIARGGQETAPEATQGPQPTTTEPSPSPTMGDDAQTDGDAEEEDEQPAADAPPQVDVGPTNTMRIDAWGVTSELSQRFGSTSYAIPDNVNLVLTSDLLASFPDSCAAMRQGWGATRQEDGTFTVLRPAEPCAEAPELYGEVWGLVDAWVKTFA